MHELNILIYQVSLVFIFFLKEERVMQCTINGLNIVV